MITFTPSTRRTGRALIAIAVTATLVCGTGAAAPATASDVCLSMSGSNGVVAGIQVDLRWDGSCMSADKGSGVSARCTADPSSGKDVHTSLKGGPGTLKALFLSLSDSSPIPDGDLFCCSFTRTGGGNPCCGLGLAGVAGSDSTGGSISASAFSLLATVDGQACTGTRGGGGAAPQQQGGSGLQGGAGGMAPPVVSAPGGAPAAAAPQAPAAGGQPAPAGKPASGSQPALGGEPVGGGVPAAVPGKPETQEAPSGMDQVQRALDQLRGAPTAAAEVTTPHAQGTPRPGAGTPTAKAHATEPHGTPTAAAKKTPATPGTPGAKTPGATPKATPKAEHTGDE